MTIKQVPVSNAEGPEIQMTGSPDLLEQFGPMDPHGHWPVRTRDVAVEFKRYAIRPLMKRHRIS
jgi:hypothetical protein